MGAGRLAVLECVMGGKLGGIPLTKEPTCRTCYHERAGQHQPGTGSPSARAPTKESARSTWLVSRCEVVGGFKNKAHRTVVDGLDTTCHPQETRVGMEGQTCAFSNTTPRSRLTDEQMRDAPFAMTSTRAWRSF